MLTLKEQKRLKQYEEMLAFPKKKFFLVYGLYFGIMMFIVTTASDYFFRKNSFHWDYYLLISLLIWIIIGGSLYSLLLRWFVKRAYKKLKSKADQS